MPCTDGGPPPFLQVRNGELRGYLEEVFQTVPEFSERDSYEEENDKMAQLLCAFLRANDVKKYSLELQIWWRDHQIEDARKAEQERIDAQQKKLRKQALSKLTPEERRALKLVE